MKVPLFRAIGLMSGTSIDGIDAALLETDGLGYVRPLAFMPSPYDPSFRVRLRQCLGNKEGVHDLVVAAFERELTELHADIVHQFLEQINTPAASIDLIGFHGQTIWHQPRERATIQIGDGDLLAQLTGITVINDFRSADVELGGHGAPLVPLYHRALAAKLPKPTAIINIGGVANITWIGGESDNEILAFDLGPGNALIDDWMLTNATQTYDEYGLLAASGQVHTEIADRFLSHAFFRKKPPKSLDRDIFKNLMPKELNAADGAATLTMVSARAIAKGLHYLPAKPCHLYITGGGRLNNTLMSWIGELANIPVSPVDDLGWSGDGLEAEAFAYLAVRSKLGLPLSVPGTTGVPRATTGGKLHIPAAPQIKNKGADRKTGSG